MTDELDAMTERPDAFSLVTYLVAASRMVFEETTLYASMRLTEAASRAAGLAEHEDEFLAALKQEINAEKWKQIDDPTGFKDWIDATLRRVVAEAKRRNLASAATQPESSASGAEA